MIDLLVWRVMVAGAQEGKPDYLEVLVVAAAPVDLRPALNLAVEVAKLEDMVRRSAIPIRMRRLFPPTYAQLEKELSAPALERRRREPRVLHFLDHGVNRLHCERLTMPRFAFIITVMTGQDHEYRDPPLYPWRGTVEKSNLATRCKVGQEPTEVSELQSWDDLLHSS